MPNFRRRVSSPQPDLISGQSDARFHGLDALRGIAALMVLIHHTFLSVPSFDLLRAAGPDIPNSFLFWLVTYTPLHIFWAGSEAVYLFFILSGFVLTLPFIRTQAPRWLSYYPKRLIRLYLPVWGSVMFALATAAAVPRIANTSISEWLERHEEPFDVMRDVVLLFGTDQLNSPLWSLQWEVLFSLLLPLYLYLGRRAGRFWILAVVGLVLIVGLGSLVHVPAMTLMPMFGIGVILAMHRSTIATKAAQLRNWQWSVILIASMVLFTSAWVLPSVPGSTAVATVGATLIIMVFLVFRPALRVSNYKAMQWVGSRSFSLYLIHEPIVVGVAFATGTNSLLVIASTVIPLSLIMSEVFFRLVERPSHSLAVKIGRVIERQPLLA